MAGFQDVGTIGDWTPARLSRYVTNLVNQRDQIAKSGVSSDAQFIHSALTFSAGDFNTADTVVTRPKTGILNINNQQLVQWNSQGTGNPTYLLGSHNGNNPNPGGNGSPSVQLWDNGNHEAFISTVLDGVSGWASVLTSAVGDTNWRFYIDGVGKHSWGPGNAALDTNLYRPAVGALRTDGTFVVGATGVTNAGAGTLVTTARIFTGAPSTGGVWLDGGAAQFVGSVDSTHLGFYNTGWYFQMNNGGDSTFQGTFGYKAAVGNGGTVTQATSLSTAVTLNTICGQITTFTTSLAGGLDVNFLVNNSKVTATDAIIVWWVNCAWASNIPIWVSGVAAGQFRIAYHNFGGLTGSATSTIGYLIIRSASN